MIWQFALAIVYILGWSIPVFAADVTVTRLDGAAVVGELKTWDNLQVVMATSAGVETFPTSQVVSLRWAAAEPEAPPATAGLAELTDGSILPIEQCTVKGDSATLTLAVPQPADAQTVSLPVKKLAAVRFRPLASADLIRQWDEIRGAKLASDALVPLKKDGKSLDYVEGVLGDFTTDKVEFKVDGESMKVDRAKLAGAIFYRREQESSEDPKCVIHGASGLQAAAAHAELTNGAVAIKTTGAAELKWPLADVNFIDFSSGKILYLSDVDSASDEWTPLIGLPNGANGAAQFGKYRRDHSAYGGPLTLFAEEKHPQSTKAQPRVYNKGLALRSRTELVYRLPAGFRRFSTVAGIDPAASSNGNVRLQILADDHVVFESDVSGRDPALPIDIDVKGAKRLKIVVDYGQNLDTGDWLNLCDARIVK